MCFTVFLFVFYPNLHVEEGPIMGFVFELGGREEGTNLWSYLSSPSLATLAYTDSRSLWTQKASWLPTRGVRVCWVTLTDSDWWSYSLWGKMSEKLTSGAFLLCDLKLTEPHFMLRPSAEDKPSESLLMQRHYCLQRKKKKHFLRVHRHTVQIHGGPYS